MEVQLGAVGELSDGSPDWDECAIAGFVQWNENLGGTGVSFKAIRNATHAPDSGDSVNSVAFTDDVFGTPFGEHTLAATSSWAFIRDGIDELSETDVLFNKGRSWR